MMNVTSAWITANAELTTLYEACADVFAFAVLL
jgi:hypothetical protein